MRIDRPADLKPTSAEACKQQHIGWAPEWLGRHFGATEPSTIRQKSRPSRLGSIGNLEVSITRDRREVKRLQKLGYKVFYEHRQTVADIVNRLTQRDEDYFEAYAIT
jgi:putative hemolysin